MKAKKKATKSLKELEEQDQTTTFDDEKREKSKGKKKSGKPTEEHIECDAFESPVNVTEDEKEKENPPQK